MITFGPVPSRRLGQSLGINNIPPKACSYSCVYCQVGPTRNPEVSPRAFYSPADILRSVTDRLETVWQRGERAALARADWLSLKVDATDPVVWRQVNRPAPALRLEQILEGIEHLAHDYRGTLTTETMLVAGINDTVASISRVADYLARLAPAVAHLAVPTRPPAEPAVRPPDEGTLVRAYELFRARLARVEYLTGDEGDAFASTGQIESDLLAITAVHPLREQALRSLLAKEGADWQVVERLLAARRLRRVDYQGQRFYVRTLRNRDGA